MTKEEIKELIEHTTPALIDRNNKKWIELSTYLWEQMHKNNAHEFRLVLNKDDTFYIHPFGVDGKTLDGKLFNE